MTAARAIVWGGLTLFPAVILAMMLWWLVGQPTQEDDFLTVSLVCNVFPLAIMGWVGWRGWKSDPDAEGPAPAVRGDKRLG